MTESPVGSGNENGDECVVHDHPVPPEEIGRYSPVRDPDSEQDIARYVEIEADGETVQHVEMIKTEIVIGEKYEIWDVTTDQNRWWVLTNLTNLYSQKHFPSLDYTLSFHIGLMARLKDRSSKKLDDEHPFSEVERRQDQAFKILEAAIEPEDFQVVGMRLRECLLSLIMLLRMEVEIPEEIQRPQDGNFKDWSDIIINRIYGGERNKQIRQYFKKVSTETWQLVNWLTHHRNANRSSATIAVHACDTLIGHFVFSIMREKTDSDGRCPKCASRNIRSHYDVNIEPDGDYYETCGVCRWSNHPIYGVNGEQSETEPAAPSEEEADVGQGAGPIPATTAPREAPS